MQLHHHTRRYRSTGGALIPAEPVFCRRHNQRT